MDTKTRQERAAQQDDREQRPTQQGDLGLLLALLTVLAFLWIMTLVTLWEVQDSVSSIEGWLASQEHYAPSVDYLDGHFSFIRNQAVTWRDVVVPTAFLIWSYVTIYRLSRSRHRTSPKD